MVLDQQFHNEWLRQHIHGLVLGWLVGKPPPVQPCSLEGDEPTEVSAPRNVIMYLNYHYVCKLPAAG